MITIKGRGRLGNAMFQNCAASILSKKFDMKVKSYRFEKELSVFNPKFHNTGRKVFENQIVVRNKNFIKLLNETEINHGLDLQDYYQLKPFVINYKKEILDNFNLTFDKQYNEDLFVHVRLGDCIQKNRVLGIDYYIQAIEQTKFKTGYISSDSLDHPLINELIRKYDLIPYTSSSAETINFGKNFNNIVLSSGTFSWWIGFLSKAENIFYPTGGPKWHGDIFVFDNWTSIIIK